MRPVSSRLCWWDHPAAGTSPSRWRSPGLTASLALSTAPTLIIWGDRDELLTKESEEVLAAVIPDSRLLIYEDTGHLVLWEQPERVASDLIAFVDGLHGGMPDEQHRYH